ncbi:MAG: hypothetical protein IT517_02530 [Burkholderiales bacterium]|nr:hypothetical protein [Burkholderiales bacterium]
MKQVFPSVRHALLATFTVLLMIGCKEETTRPTYSDQAESRIRAVEQAEMNRAAQQKQGEQNQPPPSAAPAAAGADAATGGAAAARPQAAPGEVTPAPYLPPSEHGAYVEITETPAGSPPPARGSATAGGSPAASSGPPPPGGGTGGGMPAGVAPNAGAGAPLPPPAPTTGATGAEGLPRALGPSALPAPVAGGPAAAADAELERKLREFDALMKRAQAEAERERAAGGGALAGRRDGRGGAPEDVGSAGGGASRATGSGSSPDLSGEAGIAGTWRRGPSAVRVPIDEDDDIVARQLREAASRETDPVLQKKLWDEYRKYKMP